MMHNEPLAMISISAGTIFILVGLFLNRFPSKKINPIYGYRSKASMHSQERWNFSQPLAGRMLAQAGVASSMIGVLSLFVTIPENWQPGLAIGGVIVNAAWPILLTEKAIRDRFGKL